MKKEIIPIIIEKEGVSDDYYKITELYCDNGDKVEIGQIIFCLETSKTVIDIEAQGSGYIFYNINEYEEVRIGQIVGAISPIESFDINWFGSLNKKKQSECIISKSNLSFQISKKAQYLIEANNINISVFDGKKLISEEDVKAHISSIKQPIICTNSFSENSILILGGGGHSKMCIEILNKFKSYDIIGIVDSKLSTNKSVLNIPVLGNMTILQELYNLGVKNAILGIGDLGVGEILDNKIREKLYFNLKEIGFFIPNIIHPDASVESSVKLGEGNQIMQGAIIGSSVRIGNNCIINSGSVLSHDTVVGNNVHITPGAIIAGGAIINDNAVIGMGATIFSKVSIGKNVIIKNGENIFKNMSHR